jgi:hypothetical protein
MCENHAMTMLRADAIIAALAFAVGVAPFSIPGAAYPAIERHRAAAAKVAADPADPQSGLHELDDAAAALARTVPNSASEMFAMIRYISEALSPDDFAKHEAAFRESLCDGIARMLPA